MTSYLGIGILISLLSGVDGPIDIIPPLVGLLNGLFEFRFNMLLYCNYFIFNVIKNSMEAFV